VGVRRRELRNPGATVAISNFERGAMARAFMDDSGEREAPWTWARLADVMATTSLPFVVKGVLTAEDARAAVDAGAAAVYVSNHGGRQLDGAPAPLDQLVEIVDEVGGEAEVAMDGGVRGGSDVLTAIALGADAVLVGRPVCYGLAAAGSDGVRRVLEIFRHELVTAMTLLGRPRVADLDRTVLQPARR
jgi:4-hydroxymandelate oxidase